MMSFCRTVLSALFLVVMANPAFAQAPVSLRDIAGIPVMEGLAENMDVRIVFDKAEGRIIHAVLTGSQTRENVEEFYRETLFQLGWRETGVEDGKLFFTREDETLSMTIDDGNPLKIEFDLAPKS